jgi:hypothetical protein
MIGAPNGFEVPRPVMGQAILPTHPNNLLGNQGYF